MTSTESPKQTFSSVVQQTQNPSRDQAIVVDSIDGHVFKDYVLALAAIVSPTDILGGSRIAQGRICFYLSSRKLVNELIDQDVKITIGSAKLPIRPLNSRNVRVVISNVQLCVPNLLIENELKKLNINIVSRLQSVKTAIDLPGFSHFVSFRRQVFIHPDLADRVPPSLQINHEGISYNIYLSTSKMTCAICSQEGHLAKYCREADQNNHDVSTANMKNDVNKSIVQEETLTDQAVGFLPSSVVVTSAGRGSAKSHTTVVDVTGSDSIYEPGFTPLPVKVNKRPAPASSISSEDTCRPVTKSSKTENVICTTPNVSNDTKPAIFGETDNLSTYEQLLPAKSLIDSNQDKYCLSYDRLALLLHELYGKTHTASLPIIKRYTKDFEGLCCLLKDVNEYEQSRNLHKRIDKYIKRFRAMTENSIISDLGSSRESLDSAI